MKLQPETSILCHFFQAPRMGCVLYGEGRGGTSARVCEQPFLQNIVERYPRPVRLTIQFVLRYIKEYQ